MHPNASRCIQTHPNAFERIQTRLNRSKQVRKPWKTCENLEKIAKCSRTFSRRLVIIMFSPSLLVGVSVVFCLRLRNEGYRASVPSLEKSLRNCVSQIIASHEQKFFGSWAKKVFVHERYDKKNLLMSAMKKTFCSNNSRVRNNSTSQIANQNILVQELLSMLLWIIFQVVKLL